MSILAVVGLLHGFINTVTYGVLLISQGLWGSLSK
jgi:hypothetical protein